MRLHDREKAEKGKAGADLFGSYDFSSMFPVMRHEWLV